MNAEALKTSLCRHFCTQVHVGEVPAGLAFSLPVEDEIGDRIGGFLIEDRGAPYLADNGLFLGELEARGIDPLTGQRREFLDRVLRPAGAFIDETTLEIRTANLDAAPTAETVARFLSALAIARGVGFWTREVVRSTFADDAEQAFVAQLGSRGRVERNTAPIAELSDFIADLVIRPAANDDAPLAVFLVQDIAKMNEALLVWQAIQAEAGGAVPVAALLESGSTLPTSNKKVARAFNRLDGTAFFRDDEPKAVQRLLHLVPSLRSPEPDAPKRRRFA